MNKSTEKKSKSIGKFIKKIFSKNKEQDLTVKEIMTSLAYHYKNLHAWNPKLFYLGILRIVPDTLIPVFAIILPTMVVRGLQEKWDVGKYMCYVGGLMFVMLLVNLMNAKIQTIITEEKENYRFKYLAMVCNKNMDIDYDILETQDFQNKQSAAFNWICGWTEPIDRCISSPGTIGSSILGMIVYGIMIARQSWLILVLILISVPIGVVLYARVKSYDVIISLATSKVRRKINYIDNQAMDFSVGKDIRLFEMKKWFLSMYSKLLKQNEKFLCKLQFQYFIVAATDLIATFIRDGAAYIYLIYQIVNGKLTVSDFVLYTGLVTGFSVWSLRFQQELVSALARGGMAFHDIKKFLEVENKWKADTAKSHKTIKVSKEAATIEFKDVSFFYHGRDKATISHINLKIKKGEKLALLGLNGAGKTTLVKLLCGFYHPTEGEILVNGIPINEYNRDEYYSMISAVFQDAQMLPVSIAENVSCKAAKYSDVSRIKECLKMSGLNEKIEKLSDREKTLLVRELSSEAIDFSGGEKQKLLLSRALYKKAGFLILDEPTAALDPIAENEIYLKYRDLTAGKTSLFISHRLSSTRFCDRIIFLENGTIVEEGTHESLMNIDGRYANMFEIQSRYYKEQSQKEEKKKLEEGDLSYVL